MIIIVEKVKTKRVSQERKKKERKEGKQGGPGWRFSSPMILSSIIVPSTLVATSRQLGGRIIPGWCRCWERRGGARRRSSVGVVTC
jgi:hypothetical protein